MDEFVGNKLEGEWNLDVVIRFEVEREHVAQSRLEDRVSMVKIRKSLSSLRIVPNWIRKDSFPGKRMSLGDWRIDRCSH